MVATTAPVAELRSPRRLAGWLLRGLAWAAIVGGALALSASGQTITSYAAEAAIYVLVGLSLNVIVGYVGQISLGHQGLVGVGALFAAYLTTAHGASFPIALAAGALVGGLVALLVGFVALRIRGLYLALLTMVIGITLQASLFEVPMFTGSGAGEPANRPAVLASNGRFYLLCLAVVAVVMYLDAFLVRSKAGRAFAAIKADERVAAAFGVNVVGYKLFAFVLSGIVAGLAGALFAFWSQEFSGNVFSFQLALTFLLMTVVGGAGRRAGVVVGSVLFALLHAIISRLGFFQHFANLFPGGLAPNVQQFGPDLIGALLLLLTLTLAPGGIGAQIQPLTSWLSGGPWLGRTRRRGGHRARP
jgi:branched-chain amino acid transport system permease protein